MCYDVLKMTTVKGDDRYDGDGEYKYRYRGSGERESLFVGGSHNQN